MAIATSLIVAGIGAAAAVGGAAMSASAQKKAASSAASSASQTANANNALARENREFSAARLDPYAQRGDAAGNAINSLLGLGGAQPSGQYGQPDEMWANGALNAMGLGSRGNSPATLRAHLAGELEGQISPQMRQAYEGYQQSTPMTQAAPTGNATNAFQNYLDSTGYQFQMDQGTKAANQGYAAQGSFQSGAAMKALQTYGQNTGKSFFKDYLGLLANQQAVGMSGASAVAGVGQNYVNSVSANANAGMWGNIAGAVGGAANAFGSSYRG